MFALRRKAGQSVIRVPAGQIRWSTGQHGKSGDEVQHFAGSSTEHGHHQAAPENESLGTGFFILLAGVPIVLGVYSLSRPSANGDLKGFSKMIHKYQEYKDSLERKNGAHVAMLEQAAFDRNLFQSDKGSSHIDLRFPEIFNTGAPWNVPAGHGPRNIDQLVAHYEKKNAEAEEAKLKRLNDQR